MTSAIIDGEVVVFNDKGMSDFNALRSAMRWQSQRLVFIAVDSCISTVRICAGCH